MDANERQRYRPKAAGPKLPISLALADQAFIQGVFGHATFGTIYGIGVGIVSVIAAAIQYPTTEWAVRSIEDGLWNSFAPIDVGAGVVLSGALFGFPAWLVWIGRRERKQPVRAVA